MSQHDSNYYEQIIWQQQEQLTTIQAQLQALLATEGIVGEVVAVEIFQPNTGSNVKVAKLQTFNGKAEKVSGFLMAYRLYIRTRMRDAVVEEQIQCVLSYVQEWSVNVQKENIIEDLESKSLSCAIVGEFLSDLKKEFNGGDDEMMKVAELKKVKQESKTIEKFV